MWEIAMWLLAHGRERRRRNRAKMWEVVKPWIPRSSRSVLRQEGRHIFYMLDQWKVATWRAAGMDETCTRRASIWETI
ncbi:hypothetical protein Scep_009869 [Stephania cephalantha]|uniref:Uncharacterized protein n=1 Tax=Stephania cephalantha TaxID=152367 RepID=A0AAP0JTY7_9MAGN